MLISHYGRFMLASEAFQIKIGTADDWFDPILDTDTRLFVDPFLIFKDKSDFWVDAHKTLIGHFNACFTLIAASGGNRQSPSYKKALSLLTFPEPKEMCLGYTARGIDGLGGGRERARAIAEAIEAAISRGLKSMEHFEELGIFNKGIGPDGISDMTCNILKPKFIEYTMNIISRHGVQTEERRIFPREYVHDQQQWSSGKVNLPINPFNKGPVLFVPARFLRDLPTLSAEEWWIAYEAEQVRNNLNYEVLGRVDKQTIVDTARKYESSVEQWARSMEAEAPQPYDLEKDPLGVYKWDQETRKFVAATPLSLPPPKTHQEFLGVIEKIIDAFKSYIEENGAWRLLWNDDGTEKDEEAAQLYFLGIAKSYCHANNIVVDREVELGRGPVDFKFSNGFSQRALIELKKLHNGKFWNGLEAQLVSYCASDDHCQDAWFIAIQYRTDGISETRIRDLPSRAVSLQKKTLLNIKHAIVDARSKESASKLKP